MEAFPEDDGQSLGKRAVKCDALLTAICSRNESSDERNSQKIGQLS
jgi:hypothetical protein